MADDAASLRRRLEQLQGPGLASTRPSTLRTQCEERAAESFRAGLEASGLSQRAVARRLRVDERIVRDYLSGARAVPLWALLALPRRGQLGAIRVELETVPQDDSADPESSRRAG